MFENLSDRLGGVLTKLTRQGALTEDDVTSALREVRIALLEADVSLPIARDFIKTIKPKAVGTAVLRSVTPGQQVVKIVHDELIQMLQGDDAESGKLALGSPPTPILMVGLQGSGKTTTTAKIAHRLKNRERKKVLTASLDTRRPAAMEQLRILSDQVGVDFLPIVPGQDAVAIAKRAKQQATFGGYDVVLLDTAGRMHLDEELMAEVQAVRDAASPHETLLVVDSLTGQDAVNVAEQFNQQVGVSGVVLTRMDGDGRGGAALSMRAVTGKPIKFAGVGEKIDALEEFHPDRVAGRILGMGDIVSLVEKAQETLEIEQAERMMKRMAKGQFNMNDMRAQLEQVIQMGGMGGVMAMMPGMGKMAKDMDGSDKDIRRQIAIIQSMTKQERAKPDLLKASRKQRIARGSGTEVSEINKLLKMHRQMADMMKKLGRGGKKGLLRSMAGMMGGKAPALPGMGGPAAPPIAPPPGFPGMPGGGGMSLPSDLSGFGKKK